MAQAETMRAIEEVRQRRRGAVRVVGMGVLESIDAGCFHEAQGLSSLPVAEAVSPVLQGDTRPKAEALGFPMIGATRSWGVRSLVMAVEGAVGDEGFAGGLLEDDLAGAEELVYFVALFEGDEEEFAGACCPIGRRGRRRLGRWAGRRGRCCRRAWRWCGRRRGRRGGRGRRGWRSRRPGRRR